MDPLSYNNSEWVAAAAEGLALTLLGYVLAVLIKYQFSRTSTKSQLTLVPIKTCVFLIVLLQVQAFMELICEDH